MRTWYNRKDNADSTTFSIFDAIGEFGVSAKNFIADLRAAPATAQNINVEINSPGGDVFAGIAIYNALRNSGKKVNVTVMGVAASAASLVAMAGDSITMPENTFMMVHNPWGFAAGDAAELRDTADMLDKVGASLVGTYAARTGKPAEEIKALLDAETWMTAQEAVDAGFATEVAPAVEARASFDPERLPANVQAAFAGAPRPQESQPQESEQQTPLAAQIAAVADEAGFAAFAAHWALHPTLQTVESVQARVAECRDIRALCEVTGNQGKLDGFVRADATLASVRAQLLDAMASSPEVDTAQRSPNSKPPQKAPPTALRISEVWAKRY